MNTTSEHAIPINPALTELGKGICRFVFGRGSCSRQNCPLETKKMSPADRLRLIENGEEPITEGILNGLSTAYRFPEIVFFSLHATEER